MGTNYYVFMKGMVKAVPQNKETENCYICKDVKQMVKNIKLILLVILF